MLHPLVSIFDLIVLGFFCRERMRVVTYDLTMAGTDRSDRYIINQSGSEHIHAC
jgi:hypothetical protein